VDLAPAFSVKTTQRLLVEFQFLVDWLLYLPDLNLLDFSILCVLQAKVKAKPNSNLAALHPSIAAEWDRLAEVSFRKTCHSFHRCQEAAARKTKFVLNRWLANSPTHINKYVSGLEEVLIRHEGLYFEKFFISMIDHPTLYITYCAAMVTFFFWPLFRLSP
jgi:hypothetical protein